MLRARIVTPSCVEAELSGVDSLLAQALRGELLRGVPAPAVACAEVYTCPSHVSQPSVLLALMMVPLRYDEAAKQVVYEPVKLVQDYRQFDFMSPWEGVDYVIPGDEKAKG